ncbi:hypothetical protein Bpfe_010167 [Biomphalaria pfeifferi]|uniref:Uncharacterized protein n=1 Tax=Biomphalaria pfeifferi TaxID=112525 RepID=A0AAD8FDZ3_BIOPF|nr:hypothetical protein Bpfe_010167 [Biomphalaria pfeifferi]
MMKQRTFMTQFQGLDTRNHMIRKHSKRTATRDRHPDTFEKQDTVKHLHSLNRSDHTSTISSSQSQDIQGVNSQEKRIHYLLANGDAERVIARCTFCYGDVANSVFQVIGIPAVLKLIPKHDSFSIIT